ncbi:DNA cytosine methyltransferase [Kamptonema formosum]|uniref:DNA cytosine methyltransferase n=1 Tax=Kamptonema formosum TaxID=331992 RepID=UPI00034B6CE3|nr:DNA (cytosine-5-)-methyltransferase [Oscillatoria sp. PCC 10802]
MIYSLQSATHHSELPFAELFAGIGLVRKGLERAGWQCVFANDSDRVKGEIYAKNFGKGHLRIEDIANLHASDIPDVTLITASFPCQDLSLAGNRQGLAGERSSAFFQFSRILSELATDGRLPPAVLIENVTGLLTSSDGKDIREVLLSLNQLGYSCDVLVIDAAHFLPQSRPRVFIVGMNTCESGKAAETIKIDSGVYFQHPCRPKSVRKVAVANPDLSWNFLELSPLPATRETVLADLVDKNECQMWLGENELVRELSCIRGNSKKRLEKAQQVARTTGRTVYLTAYRRMRQGLVCLETRDDGIAGCLRTGSGGSSRQVLIAVSPNQIKMRYMTAREYGRLQGVEDSFWIPDSQSVGRHAFGDAVAVPVVAWVGREIKRHLIVHSQRPVFLNEVTEIAVVNL